MLIFFSVLYLLIFVIPILDKSKALSVFWFILFLYPHQLIDFLPGGINIYDIFLIFTFIVIACKQGFIIKINKIVLLGLGVILLILFSELISLFILQKHFIQIPIKELLRSNIKYAEYALIALLATNVIRNNYAKEEHLINTFLISIALLSLLGICQTLSFPFSKFFYNVDNQILVPSNRATGSTKGPWIMGALCAFASIITLNLIIEGPKKKKIFAILIFILSLIGLILSRSRASWLMFIVSIPIFLYFSKYKFRFLIVITIMIIVLLNIPFLYELIKFRFLYTLSFNEYTLDNSSLSRINQWIEVFNIYDFKFLFSGYGMFSAQNIIGWHTIHNTFLTSLVFNGLIGLIFFGYLFFVFVKVVKTAIIHEQDIYLKAVWKGFLIALISLLAYSMTADTFYSFLIMLTIFYFASIVFERNRKLGH